MTAAKLSYNMIWYRCKNPTPMEVLLVKSGGAVLLSAVFLSRGPNTLLVNNMDRSSVNLTIPSGNTPQLLGTDTDSAYIFDQ